MNFASAASRAAAAVALLFAVPTSALAQSPSDYDRGVAARRAGQTELAVQLLARAAAAEPANADAQLQYGFALLSAGRLDEAEQAFRATLQLAADYEDARIGLARVHQRRGNRSAALAELDRVSASNAEAIELRAALAMPARAASAHRWQMDLDGSYSDVRGQEDWRDLSLRLTHRATGATQVGGAIESNRRFGAKDTYGEVRLDHRASSRATLWMLAGGTPDADFRPRWQVAAGGGYKLTGGGAATVATIEARHARYASGDIQMLNPGVEQYLPGGHWLTGRMINVVEDGDRHSGWLARADLMAAPRLRFFAGLADAPDVSEGVVVDTFSRFGGVVVDLNDRTTLRMSINSEDRDGGADRLEIGSGIGIRF